MSILKIKSKWALAAALTLCMLLTLLPVLTAPASAALTGIPGESAANPATSYDELAAAVASASAGDTIYISDPVGKGIGFKGKVTIEKSLTIMGIDNPVLTSVSGAWHFEIPSDGGPVVTMRGVTLDGATSIGGVNVNAEKSGGILCLSSGLLKLEDVTVKNCKVTGSGGGVWADSVELTNCTVSGNTSVSFGGGIYTYADAKLTNCTVFGNQSAQGGGVYSNGTVTLTNCTVYSNDASVTGGGVFSKSDNSATIRGSIIAGNTSTGTKDVKVGLNGWDTQVPTVGNGYNIIGFEADEGTYTKAAIFGDSPTLANNGGAMQTIALIADNPAVVAAAKPTWLPNADQRGCHRAAGSSFCIGAFEWQGANQAGDTVVRNISALAGEYGSLPSAINNANATAGAEITFDSTVFSASAPKTISLADQLPTITRAMTISGPGEDALTIKSATGRRHFEIGATDNPSVTISGMTLDGVDKAAAGGGIGCYSEGVLTLVGMTVKNCNAIESGGGVSASGDLVLTDCTVSGNAAEFDNINSNGSNGGGVYARGNATLTNCSVFGNSVGVTGNGGGVSASAAALTNCTVFGNSASSSGGGVYASVLATMTNCTVSGNTANGNGGGVCSGNVTLYGSIVAGNTNDEDVYTSGADQTSAGFVESGTGDVNGEYYILGYKDSYTAQSIFGGAPALANNGGTTLTIALPANSAARDLISSSVFDGWFSSPSTPPAYDQRGAGFARLSGGGVDVGAFEYQQTSVPGPIIDENKITDDNSWSKLTDKAETLKDGDTLKIDMNGTDTVPGDFLESISGKDVDVTFDMGGGLSWTVNGKDIPAGAQKELDLGLATGGDYLPVEVQNIDGSVSEIQMRLSHDGEFPFRLTLTATLDAKNAGYFANLFFYNAATRALEFVDADKVGADGTASFVFNHASDYLIVVSETDMTPWKSPFTDVKPGDWFFGDVEYVYEKGLMQGSSATTFSPGAAMTRGMLVTVLGRIENIKTADYAVPSFDDTPAGAFYTPYASWAAQMGIVTGYNEGSFGPTDNVTREQFATILWRYAKWKGLDVSVGEDTNILSYEDALSISEYAFPAMQWACGEGVISGKPGNLLDPQGSATRAEAAAMLHRFLESAVE